MQEKAITNIPCFTLLSQSVEEQATLTGSTFFFKVLWVLFPLEYVLLFYLKYNKVDLLGGGLLRNFVISFLKFLW